MGIGVLARGVVFLERSPERLARRYTPLWIGKTLYTLRVMGWLSIVTLPTGAIAWLAYFAYCLIERSIVRNRRPPTS